MATADPITQRGAVVHALSALFGTCTAWPHFQTMLAEDKGHSCPAGRGYACHPCLCTCNTLRSNTALAHECVHRFQAVAAANVLPSLSA